MMQQVTNCNRSDCRLQMTGSQSTMMYFPPIYDASGVNTNPDRNFTYVTYHCHTCGKDFESKEGQSDG